MIEDSLTSLHRSIQKCRKCRLSETRTNAVPGEGPPNARIMFVGEAPGEEEDKDGRPFRGRSGHFLDELLSTVGMTRDEIYITSSVKCRPPGNRDPRPDELKACRETWLEQQIEILDPELIVLLGKTALYQVLGETGPLRE
ncbi:MAG: uracil-DNA glycosylase, partial [Chloroflexota bacterium]